MKPLPALALASLLLLSAFPAAAQVVRVVDDDGMGSGTGCDGSTPAFTTPGAAIAAARNGDTVLVCPGRYVGNFDFGGKAITLRSAGGPSVTTLDGGGSGSVVTFQSGEGRSSVLEGFTIRRGEAQLLGPIFPGGGIRMADSSPTIRGNVIVSNRAKGPGGGIYAEGGAPLIEGNRISRNDAALGGGIRLVRSQGAVVYRNIIAGNFGSVGGGINLYQGSASVQSNLISDNSGVGIDVQDAAGTNIVGNLIVRNSASSSGSGVELWSGVVRLINNTIAENEGHFTSDLFIGSPSGLVSNNVISSRPGRPAVDCAPFLPADLAFRFNNVFSAGGALYVGCPDQTGAAGNISADPLFVEPATGDFHLEAASPSVDAGDNGAALDLTTDFDGHARVLDGDGDGVGVIDQGADEAGLSPPGSLPSVFAKAAPANAAYSLSTAARLSWAPSAEATSYEYCFDKVDNGACDGTWVPVWGATNVVLTDLDPTTMYHWQVRARNTAGTIYGDGNPSSSWRFATGLAPPGPFAMIQPFETDFSVVLSWTSAAAAEDYEYCVLGWSDTTCHWVRTGGRTAVSLSEFTEDEGYHWQARAVNSVGLTYADDGSYRSGYVGRFFVHGTPDGFSLTSPADGTSNLPTTVELRWLQNGRASRYRYCYDTIDNNRCDDRWRDTGTSTSATLNGLRRSTTYYWMVEALNAAGASTANEGTRWSFTTAQTRLRPAGESPGGSETSARSAPRARPTSSSSKPAPGPTALAPRSSNRPAKVHAR